MKTFFSVSSPWTLGLMVLFGCGQPISTPGRSGPLTQSATVPQNLVVTDQGSSSAPAPVEIMPEIEKGAERSSQTSSRRATTLDEELAIARSDLVTAEENMARIESEVSGSINKDKDYQTALAEYEEWDTKVKAYRKEKSPRLPDASKHKLDAHNRMATLERQLKEKAKAAPELIAAANEVSRLKKFVEELQHEIVAQLAKKEKTDKDREASRVQHTSNTSPSGGGVVHVKGYYRKDGTYVRPHTRRK